MRKTHFGMMLVGVFVGMVVGAGLVVLQMKYGKAPGSAAGNCGASYMEEPKPLGVELGPLGAPQTTAPASTDCKKQEDVKAAPCARQAASKPAVVETPCPPRETSIWIGHLRRAGFNIDDKPAYVLEDSDGHVLVYSTSEKDLELGPLVGQEVVLTGWSCHRDDLHAEHLVTHKAVLADSDPEPSTTVAAAPPAPSADPTPPVTDLPASREEVYQRLFKFMMDHAAAGKAVEKESEASSVDEPIPAPHPVQTTAQPAPVPDAVPEKVAPSMEWRKSWGNEGAAPTGHYINHPPQYIPPTPDFPLAREIAPPPTDVAPALPEPMTPPKAKRKVRSQPATGTFACDMCPENHLALPDEIGELAQTLYIAPGAEKCLCICSAAQLKRVAAQVDDDQLSPEQRRRIRRQLFSQVERLVPEADGTIEIPAKLMDYAGLKEKAVIIGVGDHYEIWDADRWAKYCAEDEEDDAPASPEAAEPTGIIVSTAPFASNLRSLLTGAKEPKELLNGADDCKWWMADEWERNWFLELEHLNPARVHGGIQ